MGRLTTLQADVANLGQEFTGRYAVGVHDFVRGERVVLGPDEWFPTASVIKLPIHSVVAEAMERGEIEPHEVLEARPEDWVSGSGVLKDLALPMPIRLVDAATLMIVVSDNVATNLIIRRLGVDAINARLAAFGFGSGLRLLRPIVDVASGVDLFAEAQPAVLLDYMVALGEEKLPGSKRTVQAALHQHYRDQMARDLPFDPYEPGPLSVANKTGSDRGVRNDAGIVEGNGRHFAFVMMTQGSSDVGYRRDHEGESLIGRVCRRVYDLLA